MDTIGRNYKLSPSGDSKIAADLKFSDTMSQVIKFSFTSFTPHQSTKRPQLPLQEKFPL